jgi:uncharacterized protein
MDLLEILLEVQERDLAIDRLAHRRSTIPEKSSLAATQERIDALEVRQGELSSELEDRLRHQGELEREVDAITARIASIESRLYGGEVSASRELSAMAGEVESLRGRRSRLEDHVVELMEELEPREAELANLERDRAALDTEAEALRSAIAELESNIDAEVAREESARAPLADQLPDDLVGRYESLRSRLGGIGAASLVNGSCGGCHLSLPAVELERIRGAPPGTVVTCDQCGRILVR